MKTRSIVAALALLATVSATLPGPAQAKDSDDSLRKRVYGVTVNNELITFKCAKPGKVKDRIGLTGLQSGENVLGIDYQPSSGRLLALGSTSRVYVLDPKTAAAAPLSATPFTPALNGTSFGVDINHNPDKLRVTSDNEQNLRIEPNAGQPVAAGQVILADASLNPPGNIVASAYDRRDTDPATPTTLFNIDSGSDMLVRQGGPDGNPSPNGGLLTNVGPLGVDTSSLADFDIDENNTAVAALFVGGVSRLYRINLQSGSASLVGTIGDGAGLRGLTIPPDACKA